MLTEGEIRRLALELPGAEERDHHGFPSFRVGGRIVATLPDPRILRVMLEEDGIRTAVHEAPGVCSEQWWGKRLAAVAVDLDAAEPELVRGLLAEAWERRAPRPPRRGTPEPGS